MTTFDLYKGLIRPIRDQDRDAGGLFLKRYLERPQYWRDWVEARIQALPNLINPELCPDDLLDYLAAIVGFTSRYSAILDRLSPSTKRKLILAAAALWKRLYTELGAEVAIRLLTGKTPYIRNWFDFRVIVGETILGEEQIGFDFWIIGDAITRFDEYTSQIRVMDDGNLDEELLLRVLEIMRPLSERFEVSLVDFMDQFNEGRGKWTTLSGAPATITTALTFRIPAGSIEVPSIPIQGATAFTNIITMHKFKITGPAGPGVGHQFWFFTQSINDYFYVNVYPGVLNNVELWRVVGGLNVMLVSASFPIAVDAWYKLRIRALAGLGALVFIDSTQVIAAGGVGPVPAYGKMAHVALVNDVEVDNVELFREPLRWAIIEPSGTTESYNWVL